MNNDICFVILHYGELGVTKKCIDSLIKLDNADSFKIVLLDNDTKKSDKERDELNSLFKDNNSVTILRMYGDTGFSKANNIGYKYVLDNFKPKYIVVCNNDIEFVQEETIKIIDDIYNETNFAVLGPDVIKRSDNIHQNPHSNALVTKEQITKSIRFNRLVLKNYKILYPLFYLYNKWENFNIKKISEHNLDKHEIRQLDAVLAGSIYIFSDNFFNRINECFYPETQFYCEEDILAYRCKKLGLKTVYDPSLYVYHESEASTKSTYKNMKKRLEFRLKMSIDSSKVYLDLLEMDDDEIQ